MSYKDLKVVHVVAMDRNRCIGNNNDLPWHISADLKHFKALTQGGVVVMGRKTLESMGRALPNRVNWVITRDTDWQFEGTKVAHNLDSALEQAKIDVQNSKQPDRIFIIGGGEIFKHTLSYANYLEITHINLDVQGDTLYPDIPSYFVKTKSEMHVDEKSGVELEFATYINTNVG